MMCCGSGSTETQAEQWFKRDDVLDRQISERFTQMHEKVAATDDEDLLRDARTARAAIIVLDQFPRNMFRGTAQAFASDAKALRLAEAALARGLNCDANADERLFMCLPFEHTENAAHQAKSVASCRSIGNERYLGFALAHQAIIMRFGRFPHRNALLGRPSTPEEVAFLAEGGNSF